LVVAINDADFGRGLRIQLLCITGDRGMQILVAGVVAKFNNKPMEKHNNKELAGNATINLCGSTHTILTIAPTSHALHITLIAGGND
jgi:hypothetical protein